MLSHFLSRFVTRIVLVAYMTTYMVAPVYACQRTESQVDWRYRLKIETLGVNQGEGDSFFPERALPFRVELSRKIKGAKSQSLYTATISSPEEENRSLFRS